MNQFSFSTKAKTLDRLRHYPLPARIPELYFFTVGEWKERPKDIIQRIVSLFQKEKYVVIRSSAVNEDAKETSLAGKYKSILYVSPESPVVIATMIEEVVASYAGEDYCEQNEKWGFYSNNLFRLS